MDGESKRHNCDTVIRMSSKGVLTSPGSLALGEINQRGIVEQKDTLPRKQGVKTPLQNPWPPRLLFLTT